MRALDLALHGLALSCSVALAAGLWSVSRREPPRAGIPAAAVPAPSPILAEELGQLQDDVASLRLEVAQLREARDAPSAGLPEVLPTPAPAGTDPAAAWQVALDDPKVQEKLQAVVTARLEADREEESRKRAEHWREEAQRRADRLMDEFSRKAGLNDTQKKMLSELSTGFRQQNDQLRAQVRERTITPDQAKETSTRAYDEMDRKVQAALTTDQYAQFQQAFKPLFDMAAYWGSPGDPGSRRGRRDR